MMRARKRLIPNFGLEGEEALKRDMLLKKKGIDYFP